MADQQHQDTPSNLTEHQGPAPQLPGAFPSSSPSSPSSPSPPPLQPFPLLDLPQEVILDIVHALDERLISPTFPAGPSCDLLALSQTSFFFNSICRPLVWRSVKYTPANFLRPQAWREKRNLKALNEIVKAAEEAQRPFKVLQFSIDDPTSGEMLERAEAQQEEDAYVEVIEIWARSSLQVLFLKSTEMTQLNGKRLLDAVAASPRLSALRFNQVDFWPNAPGVVNTLGSLSKIKTLQVMHSDPELFELVDHCPSLDSLLLWPSTRRMGPRMASIVSLLPTLRLLSLDAVREAAVFRTLADEIIRLSQSGLTLPLEELFLEGPSTAADLSVLVTAISHLPNLRRLALYQVLKPKPALLNDIAGAAPQLRALTVVSGDCQEAVPWPSPLGEYLPLLSRFRSLSFFAFDRQSPLPEENYEQEGSRAAYSLARKRAEFDALSLIARAVPSLKEAVAITSDVSEGSSGYFAAFKRERGKTRITLKHKTVNDFLISYDRWIRVEDD